MNPLCIYHGNCADGFGAAWVVREYMKERVDNLLVKFHAGTYQQPPPDVSDHSVVYIVDFSYKRDVLIKMAESLNGRPLVIIDHHKTAVEDLVDLPENVTTVFDLNHSGAVLTWIYFFKEAKAPSLLYHIEDRDLWRFKIAGTREIQAALFSYPYNFEVWDLLMRRLNSTESLREEGIAIERKHFKDIDELVKQSQRRMKIAGYDVPVANLPYTMSSDAGHKMASGEPFAACYFDTVNGRVFSLRSELGGVDVSEVAKLFGGGGHKHAAGFTVQIGHVAELTPCIVVTS